MAAVSAFLITILYKYLYVYIHTIHTYIRTYDTYVCTYNHCYLSRFHAAQKAVLPREPASPPKAKSSS